MVVAAGDEHDGLIVLKTKKNAVLAVYAKTPVFFFARFEFLGLERRMERIVSEYALFPLGFFLNRGGQFQIAALKFRSVKNSHHFFRKSLKLRNS